MYTSQPILPYLRYAGVLILLLYNHFASAQDNLQVYGYFIKGDSIYFEFIRDQHNYVTQEDDERKFPMDQLTIHDVTLVINFQQDQPSSYPMPFIDSITYRISFPLDTLPKRDWNFRFYINGYYAVEPPAQAMNRIPSNTDRGYYFITLLRQSAPHHSNAKATIIDQNAQKWLKEHATQMSSMEGLKGMQELFQSGKVIGIGRSEQDPLQTFPLRLALAKWLVNKMDYHLIAFQVDPLTSKQIKNYMAGDSTNLEANTIEVINIIKWSDLQKSKALDYKPLYMGYQKENIINSLYTLTNYAPTKDTLLRQDIFQLIHEVNSLLILQEEWGVYYYNSPSYQKYLFELWDHIDNKLRKSEIYQYKPYDQLWPALEEVRSYLKHLDKLKSYYRGIEKQLSKYFHWMHKPKLDVKFIVWDENHEIGDTQPGSVGRYLRDHYGPQYVSVGIGSHDFDSSEASGSTITLEMSPVQKKEKSIEPQAFVIDLRKENLTPEEQQWLEQKLYSPTEQNRRKGSLSDEFDLVILVDQQEN